MCKLKKIVYFNYLTILQITIHWSLLPWKNGFNLGSLSFGGQPSLDGWVDVGFDRWDLMRLSVANNGGGFLVVEVRVQKHAASQKSILEADQMKRGYRYLHQTITVLQLFWRNQSYKDWLTNSIVTVRICSNLKPVNQYFTFFNKYL